MSYKKMILIIISILLMLLLMKYKFDGIYDRNDEIEKNNNFDGENKIKNKDERWHTGDALIQNEAKREMNTNIKMNVNNNHMNENEAPILLVIVASAVENEARRMAIRNTWKKQLSPINHNRNNNKRNYNNKKNDPINMKNTENKDVLDRIIVDESDDVRENVYSHWSGDCFKFIIGVQDLDERKKGQLDMERDIHQDIIMAYFIDKYYNLTLKTLAGLQWAVEAMNMTTSHLQFIVKCDDDSFVNLHSLLNSLAPYRTIKNFALGSMIKNKSVKSLLVDEGDVRKWWKWLRWYKGKKKDKRFDITSEMKSDKAINSFSMIKSYLKSLSRNNASIDTYFFPTYLSGSTYVLSKHAAIQLNAISSQYLPFLFEDVHVTGILAAKTHTELLHSDLFKMQHEEKFDACSKQVSCHYVTVAGMYRIWKQVTTSRCY